MKLTNPTDEELNAAFAEKVAGWKHVHDEDGGGGNFSELVGPNGEEPETIPDFTRSADAVLPWLEKWRSADENRAVSMAFHGEWYVKVDSNHPLFEESAIAATFPLAAVIALLRAHGVEVEFTK